MGYGDELIATGLARGARLRHKQIAFGNGTKILWSPRSYEIFAGNQNIAPPGSESEPNIEWIHYYKGHRIYGMVKGDHWVFNEVFHCPPGEVYLTQQELAFADEFSNLDNNLVLIEPTVKPHGACMGANKQWPVERYQLVANELMRAGYHCAQFVQKGHTPKLKHVGIIRTNTFRQALAVLSHCKLYIGPEGGLHHGSAAVGTPAVVIWGGFNSPKATGYEWHENLTDGGIPCGKISACPHCRKAMASITIDRVLAAAFRQLNKAKESV